MNKFIVILAQNSRSEHFEIREKLKQAAADFKLDFIELDPYQTSSKDIQKLKSTAGRKLLYRISPGKVARLLEFSLCDETFITLYKSPHDILVGGGDKDFYYTKLQTKLPEFPRTDLFPAADQKQLLIKVENLGGFPIILKRIDASHGIGVYKIQDLDQLAEQILDFEKLNCEYVLQEYIKSANQTARLIVLGEQVIDSLIYQANAGDFISNYGEHPNAQPQTFSPEVEDTAVRATKALNLEFAGIDMSFGAEGNFVLEVNFPCNFLRAQKLSGKNIAYQLVEYLVQKGSS